MPLLILVDDMDEEIGTCEMLACHAGQGVLHRAFTILVFNPAGEVLIQKRSASKLLWPLTWEASCSGHPVAGEDLEAAAAKRLPEELGFSTTLRTEGHFLYRAAYRDVGSENELCYLLAGEYDGEVPADPEEVAEYRWVAPEELSSAMEADPEGYAPWLPPALEMLTVPGLGGGLQSAGEPEDRD
ncbi:MAG: isopentenyl-diphosphate Delta-isomerase [Actinomycetota bacterium]